jgi:hypothetical protein
MISHPDAVVYPLGVPGRPEQDAEHDSERDVTAKVVRTPRRKGPRTTDDAEIK